MSAVRALPRWLVLLVLLVLVVASVVSPASAAAPTAVGVLQPTEENAGDMVRLGFSRATLEVAWDRAEPERGRWDQGYASRLLERATELRRAGYEVVLDPGLQYPPSWVMAIPDARFVDQDGRPWRGGTGEDVPDAVWNDDVRAAQEAYLGSLSEALSGVPLVAIRVGGLLYNELRLPPATAGGRTGRLWGYSASAQRSAPSTWRPTTGTPQQALTWLQWYCDGLTAYEEWLVSTSASSFPGVRLQIMFPGWGLRPGDLEAAADGLADGSTTAELGDTVASGLDWTSQVAAAADAEQRGVPVTVYSTWLDAPGYGSGAGEEAPPSLLFRLARGYGLDVAGENTGGGGVPALRRARAQAQLWGLSSVMWMSEGDLTSDRAAVRPHDVTSAFDVCATRWCGVRLR